MPTLRNSQLIMVQRRVIWIHFSPGYFMISAANANANGTENPTYPRRSEEHTSELQSPYDLVCRLLLEKKNNKYIMFIPDLIAIPIHPFLIYMFSPCTYTLTPLSR